MALRYPKPLSDEEWERLVENLKRGPTPRQIEIMEEVEKWPDITKAPESSSRD